MAEVRSRDVQNDTLFQRTAEVIKQVAVRAKCIVRRQPKFPVQEFEYIAPERMADEFPIHPLVHVVYQRSEAEVVDIVIIYKRTEVGETKGENACAFQSVDTNIQDWEKKKKEGERERKGGRGQ